MLEGLVAAGYYICFFGKTKGSIPAGAAAALLGLCALFFPGLQPALPVLTAFWLMLAGRLFYTDQCQELFLAGGVWLMVRIPPGLWPHTTPLQAAAATALLAMGALYLLRREAFYPLWACTLLLMWALTGYLSGMNYARTWQRQTMDLFLYLVMGGLLVFQQFYCVRQEMARKLWTEEFLSPDPRTTPAPAPASGAAGPWREAARQEYRRLQIFEHDFRHHLDMIGALYEEGRPAPARAYIEDLKQFRVSRQGQYNGGAGELSLLMLAKKEACRQAHIHFSYQIMGSPRGIAQMDMTALLLNLLDNAVRACQKAPEPRSMSIMLLSRGNLWQIELVNSGRYEPETPLSHRGPVHGIGLVSVRQIVDKYRGTFEIRQEEDQVVQTLILEGMSEPSRYVPRQ